MKPGFALVIPTLRAAPELRLCLSSLRKNSRLDHEWIVIVDVDEPGRPDGEVLKVLEEFAVRPLIATTNIGPYAGWNSGARQSSREWICFMTDDQYFAEGWDTTLERHLEPGRMISSTLVESGAYLVGPDNLEADFGVCAEEFDAPGFEAFVERVAVDDLIPGGHFIPLLVNRTDYEQIGAFKEYPFYRKDAPPRPPISPDVEFVGRALLQGMKMYRSLGSYSYHFQGASHRGNIRLRKLLRHLRPSWTNEHRIKILREYVHSGGTLPEVALYQGIQALQHGDVSVSEGVFNGLIGSTLEPEVPYLALAAAAWEGGRPEEAGSYLGVAESISPTSSRTAAFRKELERFTLREELNDLPGRS